MFGVAGGLLPAQFLYEVANSEDTKANRKTDPNEVSEQHADHGITNRRLEYLKNELLRGRFSEQGDDRVVNHSGQKEAGRCQ